MQGVENQDNNFTWNRDKNAAINQVKIARYRKEHDGEVPLQFRRSHTLVAAEGAKYRYMRVVGEEGRGKPFTRTEA